MNFNIFQWFSMIFRYIQRSSEYTPIITIHHPSFFSIDFICFHLFPAGFCRLCSQEQLRLVMISDLGRSKKGLDIVGHGWTWLNRMWDGCAIRIRQTPLDRYGTWRFSMVFYIGNVRVFDVETTYPPLGCIHFHKNTNSRKHLDLVPPCFHTFGICLQSTSSLPNYT